MSRWAELMAGSGDAPLHAVLIDPASSSPSDAAKIAEVSTAAGTDLVLVGGSTGVTGQGVQATVDAIRNVTEAPLFLFPSSHTQLAGGLDGILFTVTFNSTRQELIIEEQALGASPALDAGIDAITTAYVIVEPGMTVGEVTQANLVPRDDGGALRVKRYGSLAKVLRFDALYLEAGSGAPDPVPPALIRAAAETGVPTIVGGGIRSTQQAIEAAQAGASMVVTGTLAEDGELDELGKLVRALKKLKNPS